MGLARNYDSTAGTSGGAVTFTPDFDAPAKVWMLQNLSAVDTDVVTFSLVGKDYKVRGGRALKLSLVADSVTISGSGADYLVRCADVPSALDATVKASGGVDSGLVPFISSHTPTVSTAGVQDLTITGFGLSSATSVVVDPNLGTLVSQSYTKASATSGTITLSVNAAEPPSGAAANRTLTVTHGTQSARGAGVTGSGVLTVQHGFSPTEISGMTLWLDGNDEDTFDKPGGRISKWSDKSGNGHDFEQGTGANQPTYVPNTAGGGSGAFSSKGGAVSVGNVSGDVTYLDSSSFVAGNASNHITMFFVVSKRAAGANSGYGDYIVKGPSSHVSLLLRHYDGGWVNNRFGSYWSARLDGTSTISLGSKYIVTITGKGSGTADTLRVNGTEEHSSDMGNTFVGSSMVWQVGSFHSLYLAEVEIAEILFYNSILSDADRDSVEGYLNGKWGAY